jgi:putative PIG3 family NAD(P)H quinone oxidoreductase
MPALPAQMTVIAIRAPGGPDMLVPEQRSLPQPAEGEVLVKVAAAGVNRPDIMQRQGLYPPPKGASEIPGLEIAGEVVALGAGVKRWKLGDKVMALVVGGGYAEYCLAHEGHALPVPPGLTLVEAAAIPETFFTVWHNTFERGRLRAVETLLVHGGSSGIGTAAIQLAKAFGARVIATAGSAEKCEACRKLGADLAVNYKAEDFVAATKTATGGKGADVVLDMVGGDYIERNYEAAAVDGRIVQIAFRAARRARSISAVSCSSADPHGFDAARALDSGQGCDRARRRGARAATHCRGQGPTGDRQYLPARASQCSACQDGKQHSHRQDRAGGLSAAALAAAHCIRAACRGRPDPDRV